MVYVLLSITHVERTTYNILLSHLLNITQLNNNWYDSLTHRNHCISILVYICTICIKTHALFFQSISSILPLCVWVYVYIFILLLFLLFFLNKYNMSNFVYICCSRQHTTQDLVWQCYPDFQTRITEREKGWINRSGVVVGRLASGLRFTLGL